MPPTRTIDMDTRRPSSDPSPWMPFESRRRARDEKREAVLRTALQSFLEQGYHRATLNDVAERLNITKPALYNYFRGKDDILFEMLGAGTGTRRRVHRRDRDIRRQRIGPTPEAGSRL